MRKTALNVVALAILAVTPARAGNLTAAEAKLHVGENATVCGMIISVHFSAGSKGTPTFVNLDKPYPNHIFTILIWGDDLPNFNELPTKWEGRKACATGVISIYGGVPEIVAKTQDQIAFKK